jgi:hypothetical protein
MPLPRLVGCGLRMTRTSENTVSAAHFPCLLPFATYVSQVAASAILPHSKLISAPFLCRKSVPISPTASVGRGHTKNIWSNFCSPNVKETSWRPFTSRVSPVTPKGFREVSIKSLRDTPGWSIDTLEPASTIRRRHLPSISNVMDGAPCSSRTAIVGFPTAFSGTPRWSELSPLSPLTRFPSWVFL